MGRIARDSQTIEYPQATRDDGTISAYATAVKVNPLAKADPQPSSVAGRAAS